MATLELNREPGNVTALVEAYAAGRRVSGRLAGGGVVRLDPDLPFLFVHRRGLAGDDRGTARLLGGEASVVLAGEAEEAALELVRAVAPAGARRYGAFLVLELWAGEDRDRFLIRAPGKEATSTVRELAAGLAAVPGRGLSVEIAPGDERAPAGRTAVLEIATAHEAGVLVLGLEVPPRYRSPDGAELYPVYLRAMRDALSAALRRAAFDFLRVQTAADVASYRALGPRALDERALVADGELAAIERAYSFLLLVSPVDQHEAWERFRRSNYDEPPELHYRLLPVDPDLLKRRLFAIALEEIDDPALSFLLRDKREELDRQISLLAERNTPAFRPGSVRLYGTVDDALLTHARDLLETVRRSARDYEDGVDAAGFAERARREFARYEASSDAFSSSVQIRPDVSGLMVSDGQLLIGADLEISPARVEPLVHHEVGTHVLTWCNGNAQPLRQLCTGLAGYDELQEGLACFSEYLVGGLDGGRMRTLAARVVAADAVQRGANFVETFRVLHREHGFTPAGAFDIAVRVHACGGFTRDAIYLRGLVGLLAHLERGGAFEPLFIGKIALRHLDVIEELRARRVLADAPLRPSFLETDSAMDRLERARGGLALHELVA